MMDIKRLDHLGLVAGIIKDLESIMANLKPMAVNALAEAVHKTNINRQKIKGSLPSGRKATPCDPSGKRRTLCRGLGGAGYHYRKLIGGSNIFFSTDKHNKKPCPQHGQDKKS